MIAIAVLAPNLCVLGGEQIDLSSNIDSTVSAIKLKVTLSTIKGALTVYSPGRESKQIELTSVKSIGRLSISKPILCVKATGGPFDFGIEAKPIPSIDASSGAFIPRCRVPNCWKTRSRWRK